MKRLITACLIGLAATSLTACAGHHYQIKDPTSGASYYTTSYDRMRTGGIEFEDARSGSTVTLQNSEISKITKSDFEARVEGHQTREK
ncbi:MAG: hypothetical protein ACTS3F_06810 [Phycisphaerales bacterium]